MLVSFSVSNFRSFDQVEKFSMEAGKARHFSDRIERIGKTKVLKFKAIYGANASGKSNFVKALDFMRDTILFGVPAHSSNLFCRNHEDNIDRPSMFEVSVIINKVHYTYGFEVILSTRAFVREWLREKKGQREQTVFFRDTINGVYEVGSYVSDSVLSDRLSIYADDVKEDETVLFLHLMNQNKDSLYQNNNEILIYRTLYRWFRYRLSVNHPDEPLTQYSYLFDSKGSAKAKEILERYDTGVSAVEICDVSPEKVMAQFPKEFRQHIVDSLSDQKKYNLENGINEAPAVLIRSQEGHSPYHMYIIELHGDEIFCKTLRFKHVHSLTSFSLDEEADGTIRLLDLFELLLSNDTDMVYVIDEISRCLHPLLTKQFIHDFLELAAQRNIQLIVTTHESNLLDLELLRQDEIGFIERRKSDGTSRIFGLEEFGTRFDKKVRNAYIQGDYGAIPKIKEQSID